jgi:hypothetical protein
MARKKQSYIKGPFTHRRTESDYMAVLLDAVTLEDWRGVVMATVAAAKAGDPSARAWLGQYLVGKPNAAAPAPLTIVVQQLSGRDPLVNELAKPHIDRAEYPSMHADDDFKDALKARVRDELLALEAQKSNTLETGANAGTTRLSTDSTKSLRRSVHQMITGKSKWVGRVAATIGAMARSPPQTITALWTCGAGRGQVC